MTWTSYDTWYVLTGAIAAMSCALPGVWLVLRRQSLMGDALSHTALPGIVAAFLLGQWLLKSGWINASSLPQAEPILLVTITVVVGVGTALLAESLQRFSRVEASAALGVVFTTLFALGLLMVRLLADQSDLDPDCVLFGQLELIVLDMVRIGPFELPRACLTNGLMLLVNATLVWLFFKELRISAFDPALATSLGIRAHWIHYATMAAAALTLVTAFRTVGSILVVGLLVIPAATATLMTSRLKPLIWVSLMLAALSAAFGHVLAKVIPPLIFGPLGFSDVQDAGTAGMMAAAAGVLFLLAFLFSPQQGLVARVLQRLELSLRIAGDDILGTLFRREERAAGEFVEEVELTPPWNWLTPWYLRWRGFAESAPTGLVLTPTGREVARHVVRAHRLWESYMEKHFELPADHLHAPAHWVEHFLDKELQQSLYDELDAPASDPHGRDIPSTPSE